VQYRLLFLRYHYNTLSHYRLSKSNIAQKNPFFRKVKICFLISAVTKVFSVLSLAKPFYNT